MANVGFSRLRFYSLVILSTLVLLPVFLKIIYSDHNRYQGELNDSVLVAANIQKATLITQKRRGKHVLIEYVFSLPSGEYSGIASMSKDDWDKNMNKKNIDIYYLKSNPGHHGMVEDLESRAEVRPFEMELMLASFMAAPMALLLNGLAVFLLRFFPQAWNPYRKKI